MKKVYLAGKITKNGWRRDIFKDLRSYSEHRDGFWTKEMVMDDYIYQGPYFLANDHGSYHGESTHGRGRGKSNRNMITPDIKNEGSDTVVKKCYKWIDNSDEMFVWLDKEDAYGTIVEIGYARAKNKKTSA